ncbi:MAG: hypothetical protein ABI548_13575 [Polyangiaceae bacterium]
MTKRKDSPDCRFASRITPEQAEQVRLDHAAGKLVSQMARGLGVQRSSIRAIVSGRTHRGMQNQDGKS